MIGNKRGIHSPIRIFEPGQHCRSPYRIGIPVLDTVDYRIGQVKIKYRIQLIPVPIVFYRVIDTGPYFTDKHSLPVDALHVSGIFLQQQMRFFCIRLA